MPFLFSYVCDLLQRLEDNQHAKVGLKTNADIIQDWFKQHQGLLIRDDHDIAALLSTLLPEKRTDRVYFIRENRIQTIFGRALSLGRTRLSQLARWSVAGSDVDIASCIEGILKETPNPVCPFQGPVTVEEIDNLLQRIAAGCRFSAPSVRSSHTAAPPKEREIELGELYKRLPARDAKWLTRLILKNFEPVVVDPQIIYRAYHPYLPAIIKVQDDLAVAGRILANIRRDRTVTGKTTLADYLKPTLGVKIGRQPWFKGRSIQHCLDMSHGRMSCEEKLDGEYCQIHIDLRKGKDCIQIFSKSGKDSTQDRVRLHDSIRQSLQLGTPMCPIKKGCILEGELVVYSDKDSKILDFHKIRKHVSRSGAFLGTDQDSQRHPWEHLMIVYYDLFMVDDESLLAVRQSERFKRLKELIKIVPGRSDLVRREIIDCDRRTAVSDLRRAFAKCIVARGEGLVLKPDDPYFEFESSRRPYSCCAIKLKKEYIGGFGDIGDFAVVGARFDAAKAQTYNLRGLKWTHFYIGCLENKDEVQRFQAKPRFVVTNVVELNATQLQMFITHVNHDSVNFNYNQTISLRIEPGIDNGKRPAVVFLEPPVFDIRCFSFDREGNTGFWSPRFPMVNKIHWDRTYRDTISFRELQDMAAKEKEAPQPEDSQELLGWIAALENADPKKALQDASQSTVATTEASTSQVTGSVASSIPEQHGVVPAPLPSSPTATAPTESTASSPPTVRGSSVSPKVVDARRSSSNHMANSPSKGRKRSLDGPPQHPGREKARRCSDDKTNASPGSQLTRVREPLVDVNEGSLRRNHERVFIPRLPGIQSMHQPDAEREAADALATLSSSMPTSMSFHGVGLKPQRTIAATQPEKSSVRSRAFTHVMNHPSSGGNCPQLGGFCPLSNLSFLLSPCISGFLWVTEDLLGSHGVAEFAKDPTEWLNSTETPTSTALPSTTPGSTTASMKPRRRKKVALVDTRRKEATTAFLNRIRETGLKKRNGDRDWVCVFDWRVLETLRDEEAKYKRSGEKPSSRLEMSSSSHSIWRQHWVGLA
ncbi:hypothetical protein QBC47DRAFT_334900 [Echria macrotheca]|uniref:ATP-dependent DNA ligase family profile domain-containing protein n=1 Tax=Echria macrotheca TaxID=438768 RepID=A0AAJ0BMG2_9PEZI|nr:hypothetical protein QBC47DRAFT_334900 [Echria macrotheca]